MKHTVVAWIVFHLVLPASSFTSNRVTGWSYNSCGHTTDFHLGKSDLPRANSSKNSRGKFISGLFYLGEKFWEGHTTDIGSQGFHASWIFWIVNLRRQDAQGSPADQRDVFFFYLTVISYANSTCKVKKGEDVDDSCPQNFFHSVSYVRFCQNVRRWASIGLAISVFHFSLAIA